MIMNCELISVGTELLLGNILNTNARFLSEKLADLGINCFYQTVVGDNEKRLEDAYRIAFGRADLVIATGGLGPTKDDLTKEVAANFFNKALVEDEPSMERIREHFRAYNQPMTENNKKQALIPQGGRAIQNDKGTAPGILIEEGNKILIILPGPPFEMEHMFLTYVFPYLKEKAQSALYSKTLKICGIGESAVETQIKDLIESQSNPSIAPYAKPSEVTLRITARAKSEAEALALIKPMGDEIYRRLGEHIYGEDEVTLEEVIVRLLTEKGLSLAVAESCTGGMIASRLINVPGVSQVFMEGVVSYSNQSKINRLGVSQETLERFGAVSPETALEMAKGVALRSGADIGLSTTGVAGPDGGTIEKPVGLVYLGLYIHSKTHVFKELRSKGDRERIRTRSTVNALDFLRRALNA